MAKAYEKTLNAISQLVYIGIWFLFKNTNIIMFCVKECNS